MVAIDYNMQNLQGKIVTKRIAYCSMGGKENNNIPYQVETREVTTTRSSEDEGSEVKLGTFRVDRLLVFESVVRQIQAAEPAEYIASLIQQLRRRGLVTEKLLESQVLVPYGQKITDACTKVLKVKDKAAAVQGPSDHQNDAAKVTLPRANTGGSTVKRVGNQAAAVAGDRHHGTHATGKKP